MDISYISQVLDLNNNNDSYIFVIPDYVIDYFVKQELISVEQFLQRYNFDNLIALKSSLNNNTITMSSGLVLYFDFKVLDDLPILKQQ